MAKLARGEAGIEELLGGTAEVHSTLRVGRAPLWQQFRPGQLLELSGSRPGKLSTSARLVAHAQAEGEPVAWVTPRDAQSFYPPDFAALGIDLSALVVVRIPFDGEVTRPPRRPSARFASLSECFVSADAPERGSREPNSTHALVRASEVLLRSGAFGLVVIDFANASIPRGELAWQARLSGLVRMHEARVVLLTKAERALPSLGPLIALRVEPEVAREGARMVLRQHVIKSKLGDRASAPLVSPDVRSAPLGAG